MFKSRLQELCQSKAWSLPEYTTTKQGYDHCPQFKANVVVNGTTFFTPDFSKSSKDAHNLVAKLAFESLTGSSTASPASLISATFSTLQQSESNEAVKPTPMNTVNPTNREDKKVKGSSTASPASLISATFSTLQQSESNEAVKPTPMNTVNPTNREDKKVKDMSHLCKNQLQIFAQKRNISTPVYLTERVGPPHALRFKCKVMFEGKTYECEEYFCTVKDAENAAAKIALMSVSPVGTEEEDPSFFKNLLQELAQKDYFCLPEYNTISSGPSHCPIFISTVEIKDESFIGPEAKTKKLAEMYAAKVAYSAMKERALQKESEAKHLVMQPQHVVMQSEDNQNINQNANEPKVEELPFRLEPCRLPASPARPSSTLGTSGDNKPWSNLLASSAHKVIVLPREHNMTLPPGATISHEDEKWIAINMDSIHGSP